MNEKDSEIQFSEFVALHKDRTGKSPSASDLKKIIELSHQNKNPNLFIQRIHSFMPAFISMAIIVLVFWIFLIVLGQPNKNIPDGLKEMSAFLNSIPSGAWTLLQIMFGFWFAGNASVEIIKNWKATNEK